MINIKNYARSMITSIITFIISAIISHFILLIITLILGGPNYIKNSSSIFLTTGLFIISFILPFFITSILLGQIKGKSMTIKEVSLLYINLILFRFLCVFLLAIVFCISSIEYNEKGKSFIWFITHEYVIFDNYKSIISIILAYMVFVASFKMFSKDFKKLI